MNTPAPPQPTGSPRAYAVWGAGVVAYIVTIMQRTSFGVSGIEATQHFQVTATALSLFVFVQVAVYMAMQVPAGILVDRFGPRNVTVVSCALTATGQFLLATADTTALAVLARTVVGFGDALMFVSVLALIPRWFPTRRVPVLTQMTGILGQLGQVLSAIPFAALLHDRGWPTAFVAAGSMSLLAGVLVLAVLRDSPDGAARGRAPSAAQIRAQVAAAWLRPGTRLGFFGHMATQFSMNVFVLLWGVPYLVTVQRLSTETASALLTLFVFCGIAIGPLMGVFAARRPLRRSRLMLIVTGTTALTWTAVLLWPAPAPLWLLVGLVVVLAAGGPASIVGFDIARTSNPHTAMAVAQSMVNVGGFLATLIVLLAMGKVLDHLGGFSESAFRAAWCVQYVLWAVAVVGIVITRRKARRAHPPPVPAR